MTAGTAAHFALSFMLMAATAAPVFAQDAAPTPGRSTEAFADWSVECTTVPASTAAETATKGDKPSAERICEAVQVYRNSTNGAEIARLAFAFGKAGPETGAQLMAGLRTVVDVSFQNSPKVLLGEETLLEGAFRRCAANYCYAEFQLADGSAEKLAAAENASLRFPISNGQMVGINVSPNGLSDALALLRSRSD